MPQSRALTDAELRAVYDNPQADLSLLDSDEQRRLLALTEPEAEQPRPMASHGDDRGSSRLATAGGMIGSLVGGSKASPVGMALAGLGGAAGQGVSEITDAAQRPLVERVSSGSEALEKMNAPLIRMAQAGLEQAGMEGIGRGVMGGLSKTGRKLYTSLLKPKDAVVESFPGVVDDLLKDRRLITQGGRAKAVAEQKAVGVEKGALLRRVDATGRTIPRETLRSGLDDVLTDAMATSARPAKDLGTLAKIEKELIPDEALLTPSRADAIKSQLQTEAARGYRQTKMGNRLTDTPMKARMAVAGKAKTAVEDAAQGLTTPGKKTLQDVNARYGSLKGQSKALRDATKREGNTSLIGMRDLIGAGVGGGLGAAGGPAGMSAGALTGTAIMRLLAQPGTGSAVAIGANELSKIPYSQLLRLLEQALQEQE